MEEPSGRGDVERLEAASGLDRKFLPPSENMHPSDGKKYRCPWIEDSVTIHSDGNVTCGMDDPYARRSFGNVKYENLRDIRSNPEYFRLRDRLFEGRRCVDCGLFQEMESESRRPEISTSIKTLVMEPTIICNIRCINETCEINNNNQIRSDNYLTIDVFCGVVDQLDGELSSVYFFNYGDPFVNRQAEDMLCYIKGCFPRARIITSTNGIPLAKRQRAVRVVESGLDFMVFTIGGITQGSYERYHVRGRVELALAGMFNVLQARNETGRTLPFVNWRYLLFRWNDSEDEIEKAIALAEKHGVDEFSLYLTHVPDEGCSYRFAPGSPLFVKYRKFIASSLGYTARVGVPDDDGFYAEETIGALGRARWTAWQARRTVRGADGWIHLSLGTIRPSAAERQNHVFLVTPWRIVKIPVGAGGWSRFSMPIPPILGSAEAIRVALVTDDYWFPAEELASQDLRCLGVLLASEGALSESEARERWMRLEALAPPSPEEVMRFSRFEYEAVEPLTDWRSARLAAFDAEPEAEPDDDAIDEQGIDGARFPLPAGDG